MGVSGRADCCSQVVKYGMFISNLIIFVSIFSFPLPFCLISDGSLNSLSLSMKSLCERKKLVLFLTLFFYSMQLGGAIVFVIGLITIVDRNFLSELLGTNLFSGAVYVLVITSALVCLLAFFGCFGAVKEIKCMLLTVSNSCCFYIFSYSIDRHSVT